MKRSMQISYNDAHVHILFYTHEYSSTCVNMFLKFFVSITTARQEKYSYLHGFRASEGGLLKLKINKAQMVYFENIQSLANLK